MLTGIFGLAVYNLIFLVTDRDTLPIALFLAVLTGFLVALYTTYDAYGIRATADPFSFLAWFFMFEGMTLPTVAYLRWRRMEGRPPMVPLLRRGLIGAHCWLFRPSGRSCSPRGWTRWGRRRYCAKHPLSLPP